MGRQALMREVVLDAIEGTGTVTISTGAAGDGSVARRITRVGRRTLRERLRQQVSAV